MHNEAKVNTNNPRSSRLDGKKVVPDATEYVGSLDTPYGRIYLGPHRAQDHAAMRSGQLASLLLLIHGDGLQYFQNLEDNSQQNILWLAYQLAAETEESIELIAAEKRGSLA